MTPRKPKRKSRSRMSRKSSGSPTRGTATRNAKSFRTTGCLTLPGRGRTWTQGGLRGHRPALDPPTRRSTRTVPEAGFYNVRAVESRAWEAARTGAAAVTGKGRVIRSGDVVLSWLDLDGSYKFCNGVLSSEKCICWTGLDWLVLNLVSVYVSWTQNLVRGWYQRFSGSSTDPLVGFFVLTLTVTTTFTRLPKLDCPWLFL
ncbi:hypothetical protein BCR34DRAFT_645570 [Clohesyomyces aquaticus]|uniref:Uncharacterized protein n=1 Tax=Clohesyomyces aquaticus TaxID=1231657 RepID=A0A1Y1Y989_9PLEO|nr:hypothetical protein BCR34DRAFT_645570 [Clohesyomyces aquaticus]